jgi:hypothetical protein
MIQYVRDWLIDKIQDWLLHEFLRRTRASKLTASIVLSLASFDAMFVIKAILSKYGLNYLLKYVFLLTML